MSLDVDNIIFINKIVHYFVLNRSGFTSKKMKHLYDSCFYCLVQV